MDIKYIRKIIKEEYKKFLTEVDVTDPDLQQKIKEWAETEVLIQDLEDRLKTLKTKSKSIEDTMRPFLEELKDLKRNYLRTEEYIVYIAKAGEPARKTVSYKEGFLLALTKVNASTKQVLEAALEETSTFTQVKSSIGVTKPNVLSKAKKKEFGLDDEGNELDESKLNENWKDKIKNAWNKFKSIFVEKVPALERINLSLEKLNKKLAKEVDNLKRTSKDIKYA